MRILALLGLLLLPAMQGSFAAEPGSGSQSGWRITGTLLGVRRPSVLIESPSGQQQRLHVGEMLDGCVIRAITAQSLSLDCGGLRQTRRLQGDRRIDAMIRGSSAGSGIAAAASTELSSKAFRALITEQQALVSEISLNPRVRDGRMDGYAVEHLKPGGLLEGHGLVAGDVIVAVNGSPVSQPAEFMDTINQLGGVNDFLLSVERDGQQRELAVRLR